MSRRANQNEGGKASQRTFVRARMRTRTRSSMIGTMRLTRTVTRRRRERILGVDNLGLRTTMFGRYNRELSNDLRRASLMLMASEYNGTEYLVVA